MDKLKITATLKNLKNAEGKFKDISVTEDLAKEEREDVRKLAQEANNWIENTSSKSWRFRVRWIAGSHWIQWMKKKLDIVAPLGGKTKI